MTEPAESATGPGEILPAFSHEPLQVYTCQLDARDALAWERLSRALHGWDKAVFFAVPVLAGGVWGFYAEDLPPWMNGFGGLAVVAVAVFLLWQLVFQLGTRMRARRRYPAPVALRVEEWGDHFDITLGAERKILSPETIRQVVLGNRHAFLETPDFLVILPLRVFESPADMRAFASVWQEACRDPEGWIYGPEGASQGPEGDRDEA